MNQAQKNTLEEAQSLVASGHYSKAADAFKVLLDKEPQNPETLVALADAMVLVGQTETSLALLADSIDEAKPNQSILLQISNQLQDLGRFEESADFLLCALSCSPEDVSLRSRTENALKALGRRAQLEWLTSGADGEMPLE